MLFWVPAGWKILAGVYYRFAAETPLIALMIPFLHCFTCGNKQKTRKSLVTTLSIYKQPASPCCGREAAAGEGEAMNELKTPPHHPGTRRTFITVSHPGTRRTFIIVSHPGTRRTFITVTHPGTRRTFCLCCSYRCWLSGFTRVLP